MYTLLKDPYIGDIYVGISDPDGESNIFVSSDDGNIFRMLMGGSQLWRTLSFIFTAKSIFWNIDSHEMQYLRRMLRNKIIGGGVINEKCD